MYGINGSDLPPVKEDTFCKYVLYYEINNSRYDMDESPYVYVC